MSLRAVITHTPGYMYSITIYKEDGYPIFRYSGMVRYTLWGARFAAKRALKQVEKARSKKVYREEVRL